MISTQSGAELGWRERREIERLPAFPVARLPTLVGLGIGDRQQAAFSALISTMPPPIDPADAAEKPAEPRATQCQLLQASGDARAVKVKQLAEQLTLGHQRNERIVELVDKHRFDEGNGALRLVMSKAVEIHVKSMGAWGLIPERGRCLLAPAAHEIVHRERCKFRFDRGRIGRHDRAVGGLNVAEPLIAPGHGLGGSLLLGHTTRRACVAPGKGLFPWLALL